ncbi:hypothetical protein [Kitasatospora sp. LaBMicrA B282]|uniref:hypothetical protein n=1 Tax=Kitasatospora sp. LaBMicrA B282 TaxID=3420949 RepID=UPI003D0B658A
MAKVRAAFDALVTRRNRRLAEQLDRPGGNFRSAQAPDMKLVRARELDRLKGTGVPRI